MPTTELDYFQDIQARQELLASQLRGKSIGGPLFAAARNFAVPLGKADRPGALALAQPDSIAVQTDSKQFSATAIITTPRKDREGDVVLPGGIQIDNYKLNPVVLWGHGAEKFPVGRSDDPDSGVLAVRLSPERALATCWFGQHSKQAEQVGALVMEGIVRATSVGFQPLEAERLSPDYKATPPGFGMPPGMGGQQPGSRYQVGQAPAGWLFKRVDLLEWSWTAVGMNPEAVATSLHKSFAGARLMPEIVRTLEPFAEPIRGLVTSGYESHTGTEGDEMPAPTVQKMISKQEENKAPVGQDTGPGEGGDGAPQEDPTGSGKVVQAAFVPQGDQFPDEQAAKTWAEQHDLANTEGQFYEAGQLGENVPAGWLFEQFPHQELTQDEHEIGDDGVVLIVGMRQEGQEQPGESQEGEQPQQPAEQQGAEPAEGENPEEQKGMQKGRTSVMVRKGEEEQPADDDQMGEYDLGGDDDQQSAPGQQDKDDEGGTSQYLDENVYGEGGDDEGQQGGMMEKPSLTHLRALKDVIDAGRPVQENSDWQKFLDKCESGMQQFASKHHPDVDFGFPTKDAMNESVGSEGGFAAGNGEDDEDADEDDEEEDDGDTGSSVDPDEKDEIESAEEESGEGNEKNGKGKPPMKKKAKSWRWRAKAYGASSVRSCLQDCCRFLEECATYPGCPSVLCDACRYHAEKVRQLLADLDDLDSLVTLPPAPLPVSNDELLMGMSPEEYKAVSDRLEAIQKQINHATGRVA